MKKRYIILSVVLILIGYSAWTGYSNNKSVNIDGSIADLSPVNLATSAHYSGVPKNKLPAVQAAIKAFLEACPRLEKTTQNGEKLAIYWYGEPPPLKGWEATGAHLDVEMEITSESLKRLPHGLRDPQWGGHVELGLTSFPNPGAFMRTPLPEWLCGLEIPYAVLSSAQRDWPDQMIFVPISIQKHSF
ncbi:hypothetical protein [Neokomagataea anthophila]|uniref:GyrI-like small molecule binding domain-containing protein n=1 Tax=Neokomagataea anthophila TaxID=2826925 RepID=A0ABS5E6K1_9PROT|nr:hypothetical protein [Neokomagataea anthophila]MBR0559534.1 hypothetical protein [Neokomagataea anthophila]